MKIRGIDIALVALVIALVVFLSLWLTLVYVPVAPLLQPSTQSSVQVGVVSEVDLSPVLLSGINFGSVLPPITDVNATSNHAGAGSTTLYNLTRDPVSTVNIVVCISASGNLTGPGGNIVNLLGETFRYNSSSTATIPGPAAGSPSIPAVPASVAVTGNLTAAAPNSFVRFWLDIPGGLPTGTYSNTVFFDPQEASIPCT